MNNLNVAMAVSLVSIIASILPTALFIYAIFRQTQGRFKNNTELICFLLVVLQFFFYFGLGVANVSATINPFGFSDPGLCLAQSIVIMTGTGGLFGLHALLALERLRVMVTGRAMTPFMMFGVFSAYFLGWFVCYIVQFWAQTPLQLWGTGVVCYVVLYSGNDKDRMGSILIMVYCVIWIGTMILAYGYILLAIRSATFKTTVLNSAKSVALQKKQLVRCVLILLVTVLCYLPNILCVFFELVLDAPIPNILHDIALYIESLDGLFTVIVLLYVNNHNWTAFKKHSMGISLPSAASLSTSKIQTPGTSTRNLGPSPGTSMAHNLTSNTTSPATASSNMN